MRNHYSQVAESAEAAEVDRKSIEDHGVASVALMETAGSKTADELISRTYPGDCIAIVCGKGNNGGDALVAARQLQSSNREVLIFMVMGDQNLSEDASTNYQILQNISSERGGIQFCSSLREIMDQPVTWWVDGIFGTGLNSEVREPVASCIQEINQHSAPVMALDVPSGLDGTTGKILGTAIRADVTLMYGMAKLGAYIEDGPDFCGNRITLNLGFTAPAMHDLHRYLIGTTDLQSDTKELHFEHKYKAGIVYLLAGSEGMTGAAVMAAKAAWSMGAGGVVVFTPYGLMPVFDYHLPEAVKIPVGDYSDMWFKPAHSDQVYQHLSDKHPHVLICGPGTGNHDETRQFFRNLAENYAGKMVFDADATSAFSGPGLYRPENQQLVITPHAGEFRQLIGKSFQGYFDRLKAAEEYAEEQKLTLLLKGNPACVTNGVESWLTSYSTHPFSRFGFGDILSGFTAASLLHNAPEQACISAMLTGFQRLQQFQKRYPETPIKPFDLIST